MTPPSLLMLCMLCPPCLLCRTWKNTTVAAFIEWLRQHNEGLPPERRYRDGAGFLGMDLYSLHESGTQGAVQRPLPSASMHSAHSRAPPLPLLARASVVGCTVSVVRACLHASLPAHLYTHLLACLCPCSLPACSPPSD